MMMFDIGKMMSQAKKMQDQMVKIQDELAATEMKGQSKDGLVTVTCNGKFENWKVTISPELAKAGDATKLQNDMQEALQDLSEQVAKKTQDKMSAITQGLNIPGLKLPF
jgi:nucleoid-associated protein EbfC